MYFDLGPTAVDFGKWEKIGSRYLHIFRIPCILAVGVLPLRMRALKNVQFALCRLGQTKQTK